MISVNVPLPAAIGRLAADLQSKLSGFDRIRNRHTLVCKRVAVADLFAEDPTPSERSRAPERLHERLRPLLNDVGAFHVAITGIDTFPATDGAGPVAYLAVESPRLVRLHRRLCHVFDPVEGIEGTEYVPHVTLARGLDAAAETPKRLRQTEIEPIAWQVRSLDLYDAAFREVTRTVDLGGSDR